MRKTLALFVATVFASTILFSQKPEIFSPDGVALKGYDVVAFFKEHKPVKGYDSLQLERNNTTWYFASQQNLDSFKADTARYIPQYGGYCAFGASRGYKAPTEIETWTIKWPTFKLK
jgi:YHS domain-containing protein